MKWGLDRVRLRLRNPCFFLECTIDAQPLVLSSVIRKFLATTNSPFIFEMQSFVHTGDRRQHVRDLQVEKVIQEVMV